MRSISKSFSLPTDLVICIRDYCRILNRKRLSPNMIWLCCTRKSLLPSKIVSLDRHDWTGRCATCFSSLIVQKYQEANKALVTLQIENDHLKQQIEQITK